MTARSPDERWDANALKEHPFFYGIDWEQLGKQQFPRKYCTSPPTPQDIHLNHVQHPFYRRRHHLILPREGLEMDLWCLLTEYCISTRTLWKVYLPISPQMSTLTSGNLASFEISRRERKQQQLQTYCKDDNELTP